MLSKPRRCLGSSQVAVQQLQTSSFVFPLHRTFLQALVAAALLLLWHFSVNHHLSPSFTAAACAPAFPSNTTSNLSFNSGDRKPFNDVNSPSPSRDGNAKPAAVLSVHTAVAPPVLVSIRKHLPTPTVSLLGEHQRNNDGRLDGQQGAAGIQHTSFLQNKNNDGEHMSSGAPIYKEKATFSIKTPTETGSAVSGATARQRLSSQAVTNVSCIAEEGSSLLELTTGPDDSPSASGWREQPDDENLSEEHWDPQAQEQEEAGEYASGDSQHEGRPQGQNQHGEQIQESQINDYDVADDTEGPAQVVFKEKNDLGSKWEPVAQEQEETGIHANEKHQDEEEKQNPGQHDDQREEPQSDAYDDMTHEMGDPAEVTLKEDDNSSSRWEPDVQEHEETDTHANQEKQHVKETQGSGQHDEQRQGPQTDDYDGIADETEDAAEMTSSAHGTLDTTASHFAETDEADELEDVYTDTEHQTETDLQPPAEGMLLHKTQAANEERSSLRRASKRRPYGSVTMPGTKGVNTAGKPLSGDTPGASGVRTSSTGRIARAPTADDDEDVESEAEDTEAAAHFRPADSPRVKPAETRPEDRADADRTVDPGMKPASAGGASGAKAHRAALPARRNRPGGRRHLDGRRRERWRLPRSPPHPGENLPSVRTMPPSATPTLDIPPGALALPPSPFVSSSDAPTYSSAQASLTGPWEAPFEPSQLSRARSPFEQKRVPRQRPPTPKRLPLGGTLTFGGQAMATPVTGGDFMQGAGAGNMFSATARTGSYPVNQPSGWTRSTGMADSSTAASPLYAGPQHTVYGKTDANTYPPANSAPGEVALTGKFKSKEDESEKITGDELEWSKDSDFISGASMAPLSVARTADRAIKPTVSPERIMRLEEQRETRRLEQARRSPTDLETVYKKASATVPAANYLGAGYDSVKGNPSGDPVMMGDPGLRAPVIRLEYKQSADGVSNDLTSLQPVGGYVRPYVACRQSESLKEISSLRDYQTELSVDASLQGGDPLGVNCFSASAGYTDVAKNVSSKLNKTYMLKTYCIRYEAGLAQSANVQWTPTLAFAAAIEQLPSEFDGKKRGCACTPEQWRQDHMVEACQSSNIPLWMGLINQFGSHFVVRVFAGGKMTYNVTVSAADVRKAKKKGINVESQIKAQLGVFNGGASSKAKFKQRAKSQNYEMNIHKETLVIGGRPPADVSDPSALAAWADSVDDLPMPVKTEVQSLQHLLPQEKQQAFLNAVTYYGKAVGMSLQDLNLLHGEVKTLTHLLEEATQVAWAGPAPGFAKCPPGKVVVAGFAAHWNFNDKSFDNYHISACPPGREKCDGVGSSTSEYDDARIYIICGDEIINEMQQVVAESAPGANQRGSILESRCPDDTVVVGGFGISVGAHRAGLEAFGIEECKTGQEMCSKAPSPHSSKSYIWLACIDKMFPGVRGLKNVVALGDVGKANKHAPDHDGEVTVQCPAGGRIVQGFVMEAHTSFQSVRDHYTHCKAGIEKCSLSGKGVDHGGLLKTDRHALYGWCLCSTGKEASAHVASDSRRKARMRMHKIMTQASSVEGDDLVSDTDLHVARLPLKPKPQRRRAPPLSPPSREGVPDRAVGAAEPADVENRPAVDFEM